MEQIEAIRNGQWYVVCDLNRVLEELVKICNVMKKAVEFITVQVEEGNLSDEGSKNDNNPKVHNDPDRG